MAKQFYIRFPQGAGGNWLQKTLRDLKYQNIDTDLNFVNFHDNKFATTTYDIGHTYNDQFDILFSGHCGFNFFCNFWWKYRIADNGDNFNNLTDSEKIFILADEARWILFSDDYKKCFLEDIDVNWSNIWNNPTQLYEEISLLLERKLQNKDYKIIEDNINLYKKTNVPTSYHYNNPYSILWISWCFAICIEQKCTPNFQFKSCDQIPNLVNHFKNYQNTFLEVTEPRILHI